MNATKRQPNMMLKAARARHGLTQEQMAKKIGVGVSTYIDKENGKRIFNVEEASIIAKLLGESPTNLFFAS